MLGAMTQFDKAMTVAREARDRKGATGIKVEGQKSQAETGRASMGHLGSTGRPFSPSIIKTNGRGLSFAAPWELSQRLRRLRYRRARG